MAAPKVVVDGTGTYSVGEHIFEAGATECEDEYILNLAHKSGLDHVSVQGFEPTLDETSPEQGEGSQSEEPASPEEVTPPASPALTTQDLRPALPTPAELDDQAETGVEDPPVEEEPKVEGFPCADEDCDRVFKSAAGRSAHSRNAHKD